VSYWDEVGVELGAAGETVEQSDRTPDAKTGGLLRDEWDRRPLVVLACCRETDRPAQSAHRPARRMRARIFRLRVESNFRPEARSHADARGLLQVLPSTAAELELDVDHPSNVLAGARYLKYLINRYHRTDLALARTTPARRRSTAPVARRTPRRRRHVANVQRRRAALAGCA
jgi:hypothetical protein